MNDLRTLQKAELNIMKQVLAVCEKHSIPYYMLGGTLLGAVRHQGFIPWDDDMDIGFPRPDYERFLHYAAEEINPPYQIRMLQMKNDKYFYYYPRVVNTEIQMKRKAGYKEIIIPAWVDIFPLDGVPMNVDIRSKWLKKCDFSKKLFIRSQYLYLGPTKQKIQTEQFWLKTMNRLFLALRADKLISTEWAWNKLDQALKENDYDQCDTIINYCGYWGLKEMFPKSVYGKGRLYPFEDLMLNGPEDYDYVLKQMYGDYMTPPPEDQREHHYIEIIQTK